MAPFEEVRELVLGDERLVERLADVPRDELPAALVALAAERGVELTFADVDEALRAARREWLERWI